MRAGPAKTSAAATRPGRPEPAPEPDADPGRRGELRIYLGAAPGVGKTFAMLGEAHRRLARGTDVVVGFVEVHGRDRTTALLDGLEVLPRRTTSHRGAEIGELDVDAVRARRPEVVLVDELAHTNGPGSVHPKRWQDIEELLAAGIDVLSTVNIQHLESLNDVVRTITGVRQQETVPDEVVRRAEQVELVDITPEALRRRLAHGNVYPAHRVDAALADYFRPGNLTALRELALLWVADQVDVALQRYRAEQRITETWEARERVVVSITGGPESETLIRRARRIAAKAGADLLVLHVLRGDGLAGAPPHVLHRYRTLAADVGASFHTVVGDDVPTALLDFARGVNATQLVLGSSRRGRIGRLFNEGIGVAVVRGSGAIDVHMVTHGEVGGPLRRPAASPLPSSRRLVGWALAVLLPVLVTAASAGPTRGLNIATDAVVFVLANVLVALVGGLGPALCAALLSGLALNYFLIPPVGTLTIADPQNLITLIAMLAVAVLVALVVDNAVRLAQQAAHARTEAALLASYSRTVLADPRPLDRLLANVRENYSLTSVALLELTDSRPDGSGWRLVASAGTPPCERPDEADIDVPVTPEVHLALRGRALGADDRRVLEAAAGQALLALRQQRMAARAAEAQRRAETTELRTALLSAVGHDLRTPLTSIKAAVGSLRDSELTLSTGDTEELLETVEESADRLTGLVGNLLDSSRLATGAVEPQARPLGYDEIVARALTTLDPAGRPATGAGRTVIEVEVDEGLPEIFADPGLLERVVANLVDNALRHGRPVDDSAPAVSIRGSAHAGTVELRVADHGRGVPKGTGAALFAPFQRLGDRDATPGVGLGLSVAKGFTEAMGGTIRAEDTPGGGLTVVLSFPACGSADPRAAHVIEDAR